MEGVTEDSFNEDEVNKTEAEVQLFAKIKVEDSVDSNYIFAMEDEKASADGSNIGSTRKVEFQATVQSLFPVGIGAVPVSNPETFSLADLADVRHKFLRQPPKGTKLSEDLLSVPEQTDSLSTATVEAASARPFNPEMFTSPNEGEEKDKWVDICYTKFTSLSVKSYFNVSERLHAFKPDSDISRNLEFVKKKMELEPGTSYKFRVAAVNSCGIGPWSEVTAFKTCLPGYPGAPSAIKISKSMEGAIVHWERPQHSNNDILEYSVYLAIKNVYPASLPDGKPAPTLSFVRVYCGPTNQCTVPNVSLSTAYVDTTTKPAIIFRIAAKNSKGYGPATQVRWLQESACLNSPSKSAMLKRATDKSSLLATKKLKMGE